MPRIYSTNANYHSSGHGNFSIQNYSSTHCKKCEYNLLLLLAHNPSLFNPFYSVSKCPSWEMVILSFTGGHLSSNSIEKKVYWVHSVISGLWIQSRKGQENLFLKNKQTKYYSMGNIISYDFTYTELLQMQTNLEEENS